MSSRESSGRFTRSMWLREAGRGFLLGAAMAWVIVGPIALATVLLVDEVPAGAWVWLGGFAGLIIATGTIAIPETARMEHKPKEPTHKPLMLVTTVRGYPFKVYGSRLGECVSTPDQLIIDGGWITDDELAVGWIDLEPDQ